VSGGGVRTTASVEARLHRIFREHLHVAVPDDDVDVIATGLLDSLAVAQLIMEVEREFGFVVDLARMDLDDFRSIASLARFVASHQPP
jgi:acyl carrier protein